jgi:hypothetical protein
MKAPAAPALSQKRLKTGTVRTVYHLQELLGKGMTWSFARASFMVFVSFGGLRMQIADYSSNHLETANNAIPRRQQHQLSTRG